MINTLLKTFHFATGITKDFPSETKTQPSDSKADFRFEKTDVPLLVDALHMPDTFIRPNGTICDANCRRSLCYAKALCLSMQTV